MDVSEEILERLLTNSKRGKIYYGLSHSLEPLPIYRTFLD